MKKALIVGLNNYPGNELNWAIMMLSQSKN